MTWEEFGIADPATGTFVVSGTQTLDKTASNPMVSNLSISHTTQAGSTYTATYTDFAIGSYEELVNFVWKYNGSFTIDGTMTVDGVDTFQTSATINHTGQCSNELDVGGLVLSGADEIEYTFDGAGACDGCVSWSHGTRTGEICENVTTLSGYY